MSVTYIEPGRSHLKCYSLEEYLFIDLFSGLCYDEPVCLTDKGYLIPQSLIMAPVQTLVSGKYKPYAFPDTWEAHLARVQSPNYVDITKIMDGMRAVLNPNNLSSFVSYTTCHGTFIPKRTNVL
jgi:hypothetical protein